MPYNILKHITTSKKNGQKLLAILLDPDKLKFDQIQKKIVKINSQQVDFIFVGGSTVSKGITEICVKIIKSHTTIPIILFPGDYTQLTNEADGVLFLSLLSGRNPEYLINQQLKSVPFLTSSSLEVIPTGYILIDGGVTTEVQKVSNTSPIPQKELETIKNTALAAQYMGKHLVYLEAGSGANDAVDPIIIKTVSQFMQIPLIVGGGIRTKAQLESAYNNGADLVVIGTAFEENDEILTEIK